MAPLADTLNYSKVGATHQYSTTGNLEVRSILYCLYRRMNNLENVPQVVGHNDYQGVCILAKKRLKKTIRIESKLISTSQRVMLDDYQTLVYSEVVRKLFGLLFGVKYIGEMPTLCTLVSRQNNSEAKTLPQKEERAYKNALVKEMERTYHREMYDSLQIEEGRVIYKFKCRSKHYVMDLDPGENWPNNQTIGLMFKTFLSSESKETTQNLMRLAEAFIFGFQNKAVQALREATSQQQIDVQDISIVGQPVLSLLLSRLYYDAEKKNRQHRRILSSVRTSKNTERTVVFVGRKLLFTNVQCYLQAGIKDKIMADESVGFEETVRSLEFSETDTNEIMAHSGIEGLSQPSSKGWRIQVERSLDWIQLVFHTETSQCFGAKDVDERAVLDLFAMVFKIVDNPIMESVRGFKSQKAINYHTEPKDKQSQDLESLDSDLHLVANINFQESEFNVLNYDIRTTAGLAYRLLSSRFAGYRLDESKLRSFVKQIGYNYQVNKNSFHNISHAFTVLHGSYIVSKSQVFNKAFNEDNTLAFLVAAFCHDVCHTGATNLFQEKVTSKLSNRYGDMSILENNSIAKTLNIIAQDDCNFLNNVPQKTWKNFRKLVVKTILATDNKNHILVISDFESAMADTANHPDAEDTQKLLGGLLHAMDFWGTVKGFSVSYDWSKRINEEFSLQFNRQAQLQLQQTSYFKNLDNIQVIAKNQQIFISAIVSPLYKKVNQWSNGHLAQALQRIDENIQIWKEIEKSGQAVVKYL